MEKGVEDEGQHTHTHNRGHEYKINEEDYMLQIKGIQLPEQKRIFVVGLLVEVEVV